MEIRIAEEFFIKIKINAVEIKNNLVSFDPDYEPVIEEDRQEEKIMQFLQCKTPVFEVKLTTDGRRFTITENPLEYFLLNALLMESVNEFLSTCSLQGFDTEEFNRIYGLYNDRICHLYQVWNRLRRKEQKEIRETLRKNFLYFMVFCDWFEIIYRYKANLRIVKKLAGASEKQEINREILKRGMKVALYGAGEIGALFAKVLAKMGIDTVCFIDEFFKKEIYNGIPVIRCDDLLNNGNDGFEMIIITPVYDYEAIDENLKRYTKKLTLSLEDVLEEKMIGELA